MEVPFLCFGCSGGGCGCAGSYAVLVMMLMLSLVLVVLESLVVMLFVAVVR